jgi:hypothetical protein
METLNLNTSLSKIGFRISAKDIDQRAKSFVDIEETIIQTNNTSSKARDKCLIKTINP